MDNDKLKKQFIQFGKEIARFQQLMSESFAFLHTLDQQLKSVGARLNEILEDLPEDQKILPNYLFSENIL